MKKISIPFSDLGYLLLLLDLALVSDDPNQLEIDFSDDKTTKEIDFEEYSSEYLTQEQGT